MVVGSLIVLYVSTLDRRSDCIKLFIQHKCLSELGWLCMCDLVPFHDGSELTATLSIRLLQFSLKLLMTKLLNSVSGPEQVVLLIILHINLSSKDC